MENSLQELSGLVKYSLTYDIQELFRFLVDLAVPGLVEKGTMEKKDLSGQRILP